MGAVTPPFSISFISEHKLWPSIRPTLRDVKLCLYICFTDLVNSNMRLCVYFLIPICTKIHEDYSFLFLSCALVALFLFAVI